ncbi:MAG: biotin transporter BioY [Nanoarchaeota archaeon]|nr:biotin transporter BioY [Nanoarchaeota archaeon]MBU1005944.1 biotin transporter BioY [Nanoarchaeota archaeon]MBU1947071.1 biotin transporter BioY [Nanoarchaeota archaeon]
METINKNKTIYEIIFKQRNVLLDIAMVVLSVAFLGIMANIRVPLWPVPVTMQTFGVFVIAFFFGSRKGFLSIVAYLLAGIVGFSVFTGYKSGLAVFMGPTAGYLIGFLFMAFFVGMMIERGYGRTKKSVLICMLAGEGILYLCGLTGLWFFLGKVSLLKLLMVGFVPFIIGDLIKIAGAVALFPYLWKGSDRIAQ